MVVPVLLNHPRPYPDEALSSWLWRLACSNYVPSPNSLLRQLQPAADRKTWNGYELREPTVFRALAALTNTSVETVYAHTLHRFAALLTPPDEQTIPLHCPADTTLRLLPSRPNRDFYSSVFAWCPNCLAEARYVRLHWHVPLVVCCTVHECWLLEACPRCQMRLCEPDMLAGRCPGCGFPLEHAESVPIPVGDLLFTQQAAVLRWLYEPEAPQAIFPEIPVAVLLRVLYGLRHSVQRAGNGWEFHSVPSSIPVPILDILQQRRLTLFERGCLYTTAFRGLLDWPQGFYAFLDAYQTRPAAKEKTGLRREFGTLYISWIARFWKHPAFGFVQQAFNDYVVEHIPVHQIVNSTRVRDYPDLLDRVGYLDLKRSVQYLGSSVNGVYRLVEENHLTLHRFATDAAGVWFDRHELEHFKQQWEQHLPFPAVVRQLGLSKRLAGELLNAQLLRRVPAQVGLKQQAIFVERDSLHTLLSRLKTFTTTQPISENSVSLLKVCVRNGSVKMDLAQVLNRVLAGKLPAYHPDETLLPLSRLWFMPQDVHDLASTVKAESDWFTKEEVCTYLDIGWRVMSHLLTAHILNPVLTLGRKQFFSRLDVRATHEDCMFTNEMQKMLDVPVVSIHRLVQAGILFPKTQHRRGQPYIFDRAQFMMWQQQYILFPEMKGLMPDMRHLHEALQQSGVEPVFRAPLVYARKEVIAALKNERH